MIYKSSIGINDVFAHENFAAEFSHDIDSRHKEAIDEDDGLVEDNLSSAR